MGLYVSVLEGMPPTSHSCRHPCRAGRSRRPSTFGRPDRCGAEQTLRYVALTVRQLQYHWNKSVPAGFVAPMGSKSMNNVIYLVGLVVIVLAVLSFVGLR